MALEDTDTDILGQILENFIRPSQTNEEVKDYTFKSILGDLITAML